MIVRRTHKEELQQVNDLFSIAFELPLDLAPATETDTGMQHWAAFQEDGTMTSAITLTDYRVNFDGSPCKMAGLGAVSSLPHFRRSGGIRRCMEAALPELSAQGYDFSYLFAFSNAYYRKFGYESCVQKLRMQVDLSLLIPRPVSGVSQLCTPGTPLTEAIREIDHHWERSYNMMVIHEDDRCPWAKPGDPAREQCFTYVYFSPDGKPKAYTVFHMENQPDGRNLICSRLFFLDREGFDGLMNLFKAMASDHKYLKFQLPAGEGMEYLMPEWSMGAFSWAAETAGMVRVLNVPQVLRKAACHGSGNLTLNILDPQIPQNNGCFHVVFQEGKVTSVTPGATDPHVTMTIAAFSALIAGVGALNWITGVDIHRQTHSICQLFRKKPLMIADFF